MSLLGVIIVVRRPAKKRTPNKHGQFLFILEFFLLIYNRRIGRLGTSREREKYEDFISCFGVVNDKEKWEVRVNCNAIINYLGLSFGIGHRDRSMN